MKNDFWSNVKLDALIAISNVRIWFLGIKVRLYEYILERLKR